MVGSPEPTAQKVGLPNPTGPSREAADAPPATVAEARSWTRFVFPAGVVCLLVGSLIWAVRRWRATAAV